jgi:hypothetical protein
MMTILCQISIGMQSSASVDDVTLAAAQTWRTIGVAVEVSGKDSRGISAQDVSDRSGC